jgi:hypothetical protein
MIMFLLFLTSLKRFQTKIFYDNWSREKNIINFTLIGLEKKYHKFYDNWFGEKKSEVMIWQFEDEKITTNKDKYRQLST